jgi:hypothetical protein
MASLAKQRRPFSGREPLPARELVCESVYLHRLIANAGPEDIVYHRNHNTLDNRRENLVVMGRLTAPASLHLEACDALTAD